MEKSRVCHDCCSFDFIAKSRCQSSFSTNGQRFTVGWLLLWRCGSGKLDGKLRHLTNKPFRQKRRESSGWLCQTIAAGHEWMQYATFILAKVILVVKTSKTLVKGNVTFSFWSPQAPSSLPSSYPLWLFFCHNWASSSSFSSLFFFSFLTFIFAD